MAENGEAIGQTSKIYLFGRGIGNVFTGKRSEWVYDSIWVLFFSVPVFIMQRYVLWLKRNRLSMGEEKEICVDVPFWCTLFWTGCIIGVFVIVRWFEGF